VTTAQRRIDTTLPEHREAMSLAATEYQRFIDVLRALDPDDWAKPTDCARWDVRATVGHSLGSIEANASIPVMAHQIRSATRRAKASGNLMIDELTALQVNERAALTPAEVVDRVEAKAPRAVAGRRRIPGIMRRLVKVETPPPFERMTLGYLCDTIFTRDVWMHRVDICRATGKHLELTETHDGRLVAAIVGEWAGRHGQPYDLTLDGPAGGHFREGSTNAPLRLDAVEFCRIVSGRESTSAQGLLSTEVLF
jgi:uncharacterized protein (TIGR03083 family)